MSAGPPGPGSPSNRRARDPMPELVPFSREGRPMWQWECPLCGAWSHDRRVVATHIATGPADHCAGILKACAHCGMLPRLDPQSRV